MLSIVHFIDKTYKKFLSFKRRVVLVTDETSHNRREIKFLLISGELKFPCRQIYLTITSNQMVYLQARKVYKNNLIVNQLIMKSY